MQKQAISVRLNLLQRYRFVAINSMQGIPGCKELKIALAALQDLRAAKRWFWSLLLAFATYNHHFIVTKSFLDPSLILIKEDRAVLPVNSFAFCSEFQIGENIVYTTLGIVYHTGQCSFSGEPPVNGISYSQYMANVICHEQQEAHSPFSLFCWLENEKKA